MKAEEINPIEAEILNALYVLKFPISIKDLARVIDLSRAATAKKLTDLINYGLMTVDEKQKYTLTDRGRDILVKLEKLGRLPWQILGKMPWSTG